MRRQPTTGARHKAPPRQRKSRDRSVSATAAIVYAQQIVTTHPVPPRACNPWIIFRTQLSIRMWLIVGSQFALACFTVYHSAMEPFTGAELVRYQFYLFMLATVMPLIVYGDIVVPWWRTWQIVRLGYASIAEIRTVTCSIDYNREVVEGTWYVSGTDDSSTLPFRLYTEQSGRWIRRIRVGSHIHILTHATKPHLSLALGFVVTTTGDDEQILV